MTDRSTSPTSQPPRQAELEAAIGQKIPELRDAISSIYEVDLSKVTDGQLDVVLVSLGAKMRYGGFLAVVADALAALAAADMLRDPLAPPASP